MQPSKDSHHNLAINSKGILAYKDFKLELTITTTPLCQISLQPNSQGNVMAYSYKVSRWVSNGNFNVQSSIFDLL